MKPFAYLRVNEASTAIQAATRERTKFIAGGTNILDLMQDGIEQPERLVDINRIKLSQIEPTSGGIRIGALAKNSDTANHPLVRTRYPLLSQALLAGASPQLRNMASMGGNLLQRTRCYYFTNPTMPCNKRQPGSGCAAIAGYNRIHAILGTSASCIATHPSDMCVALAALDAVVRVSGANGERTIPFTEFHRLPGNTPQIETLLQPGELITAIDLPASPFADRSHYLKVRDRTSYAFAVVSVAAALDINNGTMRNVRIALGGVAHKPWRAVEAEKILVGTKPNEQTFRAAAEAALSGAKGYKDNAFKVELTKRSIVRSLTIATAGTAA